MKQWSRELFSCLRCGARPELDVFQKENGEPYHGLIECNDCNCGYLLMARIPRFVELEHLEGSEFLQEFYTEYGDRIEDSEVTIYNPSAEHTLSTLQEDTSEYFGYEWDNWKRWGWLKPSEIPEGKTKQYKTGLMTHTEQDFREKSLLTSEELNGENLVLDGGCGNGRFSFQAAKEGDEAIGVDLTAGAVEAAADNCENMENIQIVQANLFHLPFLPESFDHAFSIGVLQHTGDPEKAFQEIARHVKEGGTVTAHVYHKQNPIWEIATDGIRSLTTSLSIKSNLMLASFLAKTARLLSNIPYLLGILNLITRIQTTEIQMFDWYSAPTATRHTYAEVIDWFVNQEMKIGDTNMNRKYGSEIIRKPSVVTVKGRKT